MIKEDLYKLFEKDIEFINNYSMYHPNVENNLESVVNDTWIKIADLEHFRTSYGYFAIDRKDVVPWIIGFYVTPEFRKNNTLIEDMKRETGNLFMTAVSNTNLKAINFLSKYCKQLSKDNEKTIFYYIKGF